MKSQFRHPASRSIPGRLGLETELLHHKIPKTGFPWQTVGKKVKTGAIESEEWRAQSLACAQLILLCTGPGMSWSRAATPASISIVLDHSDPADGAKIPVLPLPVRPIQPTQGLEKSRREQQESLPKFPSRQGGNVPDAQLGLGEIPFSAPGVCCGLISLQVEGGRSIPAVPV